MVEVPKEAPKKRPKHNIKWGSVLHVVLNFSLPIALLGLVRSDLPAVAVGIVLLSKWRVLAVQPRHWFTNIRYNATDLIVKLSTLSFIIQSQSFTAQIAWTSWYILWLVFIKPRSDVMSMSVQALAGMLLGFSALFQFVDKIHDFIFIGAVWVIGYSTLRHYMSSYNEPLVRVYAYIWAMIVAQLAWILRHWVIGYNFVPQFAVVVAILAYSCGSLYHHSKKEKINHKLIKEQIVLTALALVVIIIFSDWSGEV